MQYDDDLGLSDRAKEMKRWDRPYVYQEFPKLLFRGTTDASGRVGYAMRQVEGELEEREALAAGWDLQVQVAIAREIKRGADLGTAAAERAWADRHLSRPAQAEAAAVEAQTARHVAEVPRTRVRPRPRGRPSKKLAMAEPSPKPKPPAPPPRPPAGAPREDPSYPGREAPSREEPPSRRGDQAPERREPPTST